MVAVRSLTFLGNPGAPWPCSWTPAGPLDQALWSNGAAPAQATAKATRIADFGAVWHGFGAGCLRFAVQSRPCSTQDSLPAVASSTGRDWLPAGFQRKVSSQSPYITFLLSQAFVTQGLPGRSGGLPADERQFGRPTSPPASSTGRSERFPGFAARSISQPTWCSGQASWPGACSRGRKPPERRLSPARGWWELVGCKPSPVAVAEQRTTLGGCFVDRHENRGFAHIYPDRWPGAR